MYVCIKVCMYTCMYVKCMHIYVYRNKYTIKYINRVIVSHIKYNNMYAYENIYNMHGEIIHFQSSREH